MIYEQVIQAIVNGVGTASLLVMISLGLTIVFGVLGVLNFAQGDFMTIAAYVGLSVFGVVGAATAGVVGALGSLLLLIPLGAAIGAVFYWGVLHPTRRRTEENRLIATFGLALVIQAVIGQMFGLQPLAGIYDSGSARFAAVVVPHSTTLNVFVAATATIALIGVMRWTPLGRSIRAVAQDPDAAELTGISTVRTRFYAVLLACTVTSIGGLMIFTTYLLTPQVGFGVILLGFSVVVLGGLGSIGGAIAASLVIGVAVSITSSFSDASYAALVPFVVIMATLLIRPNGLARQR